MKKVHIRVTVTMMGYQQVKDFDKNKVATDYIKSAKKMLKNIPEKDKDFLVEYL